MTERRLPLASPLRWLIFAAQVVAVGCVQLSDDIVRGNLFRPSAAEAIGNAEQIIQFEQAHGIFIEPYVQIALRQSRALLGLLTWDNVVAVTNVIYAFGHLAVPLTVAVWIFARHRCRWPMVRNTALLTNICALIGYVLYPVAPPRLMPRFDLDHHLFRFQDTMQHVIGDGKINGMPIGYNPYSAMPSLHVAWALLAACCVVLVARQPLVRALAVTYPFLMLFTVVVTANHYLLDAAGGVGVVLVAIVLAMALEWYRGRLQACRVHGPSLETKDLVAVGSAGPTL